MKIMSFNLCKLTTSKIKDHFHVHIFGNNKRGKEMASVYNAGRILIHIMGFFLVSLFFWFGFLWFWGFVYFF